MLPVYYDPTPLCSSEIISAKESWKLINDNMSPFYFEQINNDLEFQERYPTCLDWFIATFYKRLFDIHPVYAIISYFVVNHNSHIVCVYSYVNRCFMMVLVKNSLLMVF